MEMALTTDYEQDRQEIEELMLRFLPYYMAVSYTHLLSQTGRLIVQNNSEDYSQYEIEIEWFKFYFIPVSYTHLIVWQMPSIGSLPIPDTIPLATAASV